MRKQIKLLSSNRTWSANGRYKVNEVVTFEGQDYQNVTGANSSPDDLVDWFLVDSGFTPTLQQVSDEGGLSNGANVRQGTTNAGLGGNKGIALRCSVDYELKWEAGRLYAMESDGFTIRETSYNFDIAPTDEDDEGKGFVVGSRWILDNGDTYVCVDQATGTAIWELQPNLNDFIPINGTTLANPITGDLEILGNADLKIYAENSALNNSIVSINFFEDFLGLISTNDDDSSRLDLNVTGLQFSTTSTVSKGMVGNAEYNKQGDRKAFAQMSDIIDRGVNNTTTIALTSANLNSAYPSATTGFRVYCTSIIAGKMVYEKTPTGWVGMAVIIP
jgi:hypothetical protein